MGITIYMYIYIYICMSLYIYIYIYIYIYVPSPQAPPPKWYGSIQRGGEERGPVRTMDRFFTSETQNKLGVRRLSGMFCEISGNPTNRGIRTNWAFRTIGRFEMSEKSFNAQVSYFSTETSISHISREPKLDLADVGQVEVQVQERIVEVPHIQTIEKVVEARFFVFRRGRLSLDSIFSQATQHWWFGLWFLVVRIVRSFSGGLDCCLFFDFQVTRAEARGSGLRIVERFAEATRAGHCREEG